MNNPNLNHVADTLSKNTEELHHTIPNVAQALQTKGATALNYLNMKLPKPASEMIGDHEYEPSKSEKSGWMDIHDVVNDPISALDHVRHGTLTSNHMDALMNVHPELLDEMREKVMGEMEPKVVQKLPSSTKTSLGLFLGSPVSESLTPQSILMNQMAMQKPGQGSQGSASGTKSTLGGLEDLKLGQRSSTETENLDSDT